MNKEIKKNIVPKLRFLDFHKNGDWEEKQFSDILDYERPDNYIVTDTNYLKTGIPVLTANKSFILGYTHEQKGIYKNLPAIIFDDFTVDKKYVNFPFKIKSSAIKILHSKGKNNLKFIFELMAGVKFEAKEHKRYYISVYQNLFVPIPKPDEQQKIADCLSTVDDLITAEKQKLDALKDHKKGLMQQLFPVEGEMVPKLRFEEFRGSGKWDQDVLCGKDIAVFVNEKMTVVELTLENYVSTENMQTDYAGVTLSSKLPVSGSVTRFIKGDVLLSNIRPYLKKVWFASFNGGASNDVIVIRARSKINASLLSVLLKNDIFINYIMKGAEGVKMPRGDKDLIKEYPLAFPKKEEQQKIVSCLFSLDELILTQAKKIEELKKHKKGLMHGLFVGINESIND